MFIQERGPLGRRHRGAWVIGTAGAMALMLAFGPAPLANGEAPAEKEAGEALGYSGKVTEKGTGRPIVGATVTVRRFIKPDPKTGGKRVLQETTHRTDAEGRYQFSVPPEQMAEPWLAIVLRVEHPDYPPDDQYDYEFGGIPRNARLGDRPSFDVELSAGKPITGVVETPDGKPAPGVLVHCSSFFAPEAKPGHLVICSGADTRTDERGASGSWRSRPARGPSGCTPRDTPPRSTS